LHDALGSMREAVAERRGFVARTSERKFFLAITHPLGPMIVLRLLERLATAAPKISLSASTRSRPIELDRALRDGRIDAAIDWIEPQGDQFKSTVLFEDVMVAVAREGHPALRRPASMKTLREGSFVALRPRVEGEHPVAGLREWQRLNLHVALEVSEILEVFMVTSQSDLFGLIPRSMERIARSALGLRPLGIGPKSASVPIKLIWHAHRDGDPGQVFLRKELGAAARKIVERG